MLFECMVVHAFIRITAWQHCGETTFLLWAIAKPHQQSSGAYCCMYSVLVQEAVEPKYYIVYHVCN